MGKKTSQPSKAAVPNEKGTRPKLTSSEKRKLYIAGLLSIVMLVVGYLTIRSVFVASYDARLGGLWQLERIVLEKTDSSQQDQVALKLLTKEMEEGPTADYRILTQDEPVHTPSGEQLVPELGAFKVELLVEGLTLYPEVEASLEQGLIEITKAEDAQGILKRMQAFTLEDGTMAFCFGFDEEPQVSSFESTKEAVRIQFSPVGFSAENS